MLNYFDAKQMDSINYQFNARTLVFQYEKLKLYQYQTKNKNRSRAPLLVVFATINRPEILDLFPQYSFINSLLQKSLDVYLLDWGYPNEYDYSISMEDQVEKYLNFCVEYIIKKTGVDKINLLGICQGGLLSLCYTAIFHTIENLILISTPIDFHTKENSIARILARINIDNLICPTTNIPGSWLTHFFFSLSPFKLLAKQNANLRGNLSNQTEINQFLLIEKWLNDSPDQSASAFRKLIVDCYQQNKLIKNEFYLNNKRIDLKKITIPILNIIAKKDNIVPKSASCKLRNYIGSKKYSQKYYTGGHTSIYLDTKVNAAMAQCICEWINKNSK